MSRTTLFLIVITALIFCIPASAQEPQAFPTKPNPDLNEDYEVNSLDVFFFSLAWNWMSEQYSHTPLSENSSSYGERSDFNDNGVVDKEDGYIFTSAWKEARRVTETPRPTATSVPPTPTLTSTPEPPTPTPTPTITSTPTATFTPTDTPEPTATSTPTITPTPTSAYVIITGVVKSEDNKPIAGAAIIISGMTVYSAADGSYSVKLFGPGTYGIHAEAPGYEDYDKVERFTESREYDIILHLPAPTPTPTPTPVSVGISALIIHSWGEEDRHQPLVSFLEERGIKAEMRDIDTLLLADDLEDWALLITETNIGMSQERWDAFVNFVLNSGKPVLGLADGGRVLFERLNLSIVTWGGECNTIRVIVPQHPIFTTPNNMGVVMGEELQLYYYTIAFGFFYSHIPPNIQVLGESADAEQGGVYPIVMENGLYLLWGFRYYPPKMTEEGKDLFENVIHFVASLGG